MKRPIFAALVILFHLVFVSNFAVAADHNSNIHFQDNFSGEKVTVFVRRNGTVERIFSKRIKTEPDIGFAAAVPVKLEPNDKIQITCIARTGPVVSIEYSVPQSIPKYCSVRFVDGKLSVKWTDKTPLYD